MSGHSFTGFDYGGVHQKECRCQEKYSKITAGMLNATRSCVCTRTSLGAGYLNN